MGIKDIPTGEMLVMVDMWLSKFDLIDDDPVLAGLKPYMEQSKEHLSAAQNARAVMSETMEERRAASKALKDLDRLHDRACHVLYHSLRLFSKAYPEAADRYDHARATLFPEGLGVVLSSYANEVGEVERLRTRVENDAQTQQTLEGAKLGERSLWGWFEELVDVGKRMQPLVGKLMGKVEPEQVLREFEARNEWMRLLGNLRSLLDLAGVEAGVKLELIGPVLDAAQKYAKPVSASTEAEAEPEK